MATTAQPGIYLIINFNWPTPIEKAHAAAARTLHDRVQGQTWIREVVAASGGVGAGPSSTWIFWLANYAALDRLLRSSGEDPIGQAYVDFFSQMPLAEEVVRAEVVFL